MNTCRHTISASALAFYLLALSITLRLVLGNTILNNTYPYTSEGGNPALKIHPGTWIILLSLLIFGSAIGYGKFLSNFVRNNKPIFIATVCTCITMIYTIIMWGAGGAAYFVDTYLYSLIALFLAVHLNKQHTTKLFKLIACIIALNSLIAIYEYVTRSHLVPNPLTGADWFFRANALMAHPLNNALVTISVALGVLVSPISNSWRWTIVTLSLFALLAFATRASLAVYILATSFILWTYAFTGKLSKRNRLLYVIVIPFLVVLLLIGFYLAIFYTQIGFGIASRLTFDTSAMARLDAVDFMLSVNVKSYLFGAGTEGFSQLVARFSSVSIIENFWIQLVVSLGLPVFGILIYGFFTLTKWLAAGSSLQYKIVIITFLLAASTNNSLSIKTAALTVFILTLYLIKRMHEFQASSSKQCI